LRNEQRAKFDLICFITEQGKHLRSLFGCKDLCKKLQHYTGKETISLDSIDKRFVLDFQRYLNELGTLGINSVYGLLQRLSSFLNKAAEMEYIRENPFNRLPRSLRARRKLPVPNYLTSHQLERLAMNSDGIPVDVRHCFFLSCFTGLRWSDCSRLTWGNVVPAQDGDQHRQAIRVIQRKSESTVLIPLSEQARLLLDRLKPDQSVLPSDCLIFPMLYEQSDKTLKRGNANRWLHRWAKMAGIAKLHFHMARHTFATLMLSFGADLYTVSKLLGHSSIQHTVIYAQVIDEKRQAAVQLLPVLKNIV
jgi:site-specific recombinase XerD